MTSSEKGNEEYEWEFVDPPPNEFDCPICRNVLSEPNLTTCCGSHFCEVCIEPIVREGKPCPECNERGFSAFLDKSIRRKIFEFDVRCPMWRRGCNWNGELANRNKHLDVDCQFVDINCPKSCGVRVQRHELPGHLARDCPKRNYVCDFCDFEANYDVVITQHWPVCENFSLPCPNECGVGAVNRCHFEEHLCECPLQVVECDFNYAGCTAKVHQQDLRQHMEENTQNHLRILAQFTVDTIKQLCEEKDQQIADLRQEKDQQIAELRREKDQQIADLRQEKDQQIADLRQEKDQQIADLRQEKDQQITDLLAKLPSDQEMEERESLDVSVEFCHSFQFSMPKFSYRKARKPEHWYSSDFYTSDGYKMQISVVTNSGTGDGVISVYAYVKRGRFDHKLAWPLKATISLQLNNPNGEYSPYERSLEGEWKRTTFIDRRNFCKWDPFITHAEVENYLKDDTLHFQVVMHDVN